MALMTLTGLAMILQMAASNTILQTLTDDDKRGRVMSFYSMAFFFWRALPKIRQAAIPVYIRLGILPAPTEQNV